MVESRITRILSLLLILSCLLLSMSGLLINASVALPSCISSSSESCSTPQDPAGTAFSASTKDYQKTAFFEGSITGALQQERQLLQPSLSNSSVFSRHMMCKDNDIYFNPIYPTTIFNPSDAKAECLTTVTINNTIEFRWFYRSNSSKTWISCYNWTENALFSREYYYAGFLLIAGYWPGLNYPMAYKVGVYLDGYLSFYEFFEVTNGGLNSPRTCEDIDANGRPVNMKSRFTIGVDTKICNYLSFTNIAYFNEELEDSHNFTTVWIQPDGSNYEEFSLAFADYKDTDITWNCWKYAYTNDSYIFLNSSIPVGNWRVEVYLDDYYLNGTWIPYGPISTTPFIVGSGPVADWTFMVYLDGDNSLESAAIETFLNMASVGSSPQVNIVVQMDRIGIDDRYGNWTECKRFYIIKGMTPTPGNATQDLGEVDMGDPETLKDFVNWTMNNYPANRYFLVLWDHGAGFMGFCFDVTSSGDALTLPKLSQALSGLPAIMDAVLIDACSTSMIEAAYQIKDYANVLIGPEDLGYEPAPYGDYLSSLTGNSTVSPNAFASEIVTDYVRWCFSVSNIQNATMSATDLTQITSLSTAIDDYALLLKEKETPYHEQISLARSLAEGFQGPYAGQTGYFIDLYDFVRLSSQYVSDEELGAAADNLMAAVGNTVIMTANKGLPYSHGLSIFLPDGNEKYKSYEDSYEETNFADDTLWNDFIKYDLSGYVLTIQTSQVHFPVTVDNESYTSDNNGEIHVFVLPQSHNVSVTSPYLTGPGSRAVFSRWNDTDTSNPRTLFVNETLTLSTEYETQYRFFMERNFGTTDPDVGEHWYNASSTFRIGADPPASTSVERFRSLTWTGEGEDSYSGSDASAIITMNEPINETATWTHEYFLTVTSPQGQSSPTPTSGWFEAGQLVIMSVTTPVPGPTGTQYACTGWNGTGSVPTYGTTPTDFTINQPSSITWNWKTQYHFVISTDPAGLSLPPKPSSGWYDEGNILDCVAENVSGKIFDHWTVKSLTTDQLSTYEYGMSKINVTIDGSYEAVAHYASAAAWWDSLFHPGNPQTLLVLALVIVTVSFLGALLIMTRRRKSNKKAVGQPTIKVPKQEDFLPDRVTTGFEDLDSLLFGGLPKNYAVALTSPSCDERDMLIKRFIEAGARNGQVTFYVTVDPGSAKSLAEEFQSNFYLFICSPRADTMIESAENLPNVFKLKGVENLTEISIALTKAFRTLDASMNGPRRACIGIISDVLLQHHAVQTKRWLSDLIPELRSKGFTTLAVMNPQMLPPEEVQAILELFEGEISIHEKEGLQKTVRIQKMYNQKYLDCELPLIKGK